MHCISIILKTHRLNPFQAQVLILRKSLLNKVLYQVVHVILKLFEDQTRLANHWTSSTHIHLIWDGDPAEI